MGNLCGCGNNKRETDESGDIVVDLTLVKEPELLWEKQFPMCKISITKFHENLNKSGQAKQDIDLKELACEFNTPAWRGVFEDVHPFARMLKALPEWDDDTNTLVYAPKRGAEKKTIRYQTLLCLAVLWCDGTPAEKAAALV